MSNRIHLVRETIENHLGDLCPISDAEISETLDLMGEDLTEEALEEALAEVLGQIPDWDQSLFEDLSTLLLEDRVAA